MADKAGVSELRADRVDRSDPEAWLEFLRAALPEFGVSGSEMLSDDAAVLLSSALELAPPAGAGGRESVASTTVLFLTAVLWGAGMLPHASLDPPPAFRALAGAVAGSDAAAALARETLGEGAEERDFMDLASARMAGATPPNSTILSISVRGALDDALKAAMSAGGDAPVTATQILAEVLRPAAEAEVAGETGPALTARLAPLGGAARMLELLTGAPDDGASRPAEAAVADDADLASDKPERFLDLLDRAPLALSLVHLLNRVWEEENRGPPDPDAPSFVMHLDAPWGGGKTTVANYLEALLTWTPGAPGPDPWARLGLERARPTDPGPPWTVVWFNAWRNQHVRPPWWNFWGVIRRQLHASRGPLGRLAARTDEALWRLRATGALTALGVAALAAGLLAAASWTGLVDVPGMVAGAGAGGGGTATVVASALAALVAGGAGLKLFSSLRTGAQTLVDSLSSSADAATLGEADPLARFRARFADVMRRHRRPVLVIVDDIDRCEPDCVVELMRGIMTVFRSPRVVFLLLGDRFWIERCFEHAHASMAAGRGGFGAQFVEKAIQASVQLPEPPEARMRAYLAHLLLRGHEPAGEAPPPTAAGSGFGGGTRLGRGFDKRDWARDFDEAGEAAAAQDARRTEAVEAAAEARPDTEVRHRLVELGARLPANPRRVKRIVNMIAIYRISLVLAFGRTGAAERWPRLALWVLLMSEHPAAWRLLCADPDLADAVQEGALPEPEGATDRLAPLRDREAARLIRGEGLAAEGVRLDAAAASELRTLTPVA